MGNGERAARPFNRRILLPLLCGSRGWCWQVVSYLSLCLLPCLVAVFILRHGLGWQAAAFGGAVMAGLPTMQFWLKTPVLTDAAGMVLALGAALLPFPWNLVVCVIGGFCRETVPIFAALYAWNPILLIGVIPIGLYGLFAPVGGDQLGRESWLSRPFANAQAFKRGLWRQAGLFVTPWGAGLAALWFPSWQMVAVCLVAYAQTLVATDAARLFVWAAPVVLLQAGYVDPSWMLPLAVFHWVNPWRGSGA